MAVNPFERSRVASGTMEAGAQKPKITGAVPEESKAISSEEGESSLAAGRRPLREGRDYAPRTVVPVSNLLGNHVRNPAGESLGIIEQIMLDIRRGSIAYAVLSFGGFLGIGDKLFAVPWRALRRNNTEDEFILDVDRKLLEKAPGFNKENWPDMADPGFAAAIHDYYGQKAPAEQDFTDAGDYIGDEDSRRISGKQR